jgi:hypothetical protein
MLDLLHEPLALAADVSCTPFPSVFFDALSRDVRPDLVVVDVTYLDENRVRPEMIERFADSGCLLVFTTATGYAWMDDLGHGRSDYLPDATPETLMGLVQRPRLQVVMP